MRDESYLRRHVVSFFGSYEVGSITKSLIEQWVRGLSSVGLSAGTVRQCFRILRCVLDDAVDRGLISSSPCKRIGLPRVVGASPLFLGPSEVARLASCIEPRFSALVLTAAYLGLRWGELTGLLRSSLSLSTSGAGCSRSGALDGGATSGRGAVESSGSSGSEPPSRRGESFPPSQKGEAARTGAVGSGASGEPGGSGGFGVGGSLVGAGRSRSERLGGGATSGGGAIESGPRGEPGGSDSLGAGASLLQVIGTLEEVAGLVRYVSETKSRGGPAVADASAVSGFGVGVASFVVWFFVFLGSLDC